eukprot:scaffold24976_cov20-Tisochrysis_lutea.AAC.3
MAGASRRGARCTAAQGNALRRRGTSHWRAHHMHSAQGNAPPSKHKMLVETRNGMLVACKHKMVVATSNGMLVAIKNEMPCVLEPLDKNATKAS